MVKCYENQIQSYSLDILFYFFYREKKVFPGVNLIQPDASTEQYDEFLNRRHWKLVGWLTDGGDMRRIEFTLREPAQHARLPNPRVSEHEQPEQNIVLFSHDHKLKHRRKHDSFMWLLADAFTSLLLRAAFTAHRKLLLLHCVHYKYKNSRLENRNNSDCFTKAVVFLV